MWIVKDFTRVCYFGLTKTAWLSMITWSSLMICWAFSTFLSIIGIHDHHLILVINLVEVMAVLHGCLHSGWRCQIKAAILICSSQGSLAIVSLFGELRSSSHQVIFFVSGIRVFEIDFLDNLLNWWRFINNREASTLNTSLSDKSCKVYFFLLPIGTEFGTAIIEIPWHVAVIMIVVNIFCYNEVFWLFFF